MLSTLRTLGALSILVSASPLAAQVTVIKAGRLLDTERGMVATNQIIIIRAGKIEEVGSSLAIPAGAKVIDLSGMTVLPGSSTATRISRTAYSSPMAIRARFFFTPPPRTCSPRFRT